MPASPSEHPAATQRDGDLYQDRLMREALVGAGTSVWAWDIEQDALGGIDAGVALLGYAPGDRARTQAAWNELIHPDDLRAIDIAYARHAGGDAADYECEYRALARDGGWRWLAERGRIVEWWPDGRPRRMVGTLTDVTRRRVAESRARDIADRLREIARHVPGVLYQFRRLGDSDSFSYASERCEAVLGFTSAELMRDARTLFGRIHPDDAAALREITEVSAATLGPWRGEFRLPAPGGGWRWVLGISSPQRAADGALVWHGYLQDVTELRELERAREHASAAEAANRAKSEFLSRMSHEFRTPLNAVLGFAQLMELDSTAGLAEVQRRRVAIIRESGEHLLRMIGDLLDHARIDAGQLSVDLGDVALAPLLQRCAEMMAPQAQAAQVGLTLGAVDAALQVQADTTRLRQVLLNLLGNAIKYNRPGGNVRIEVQPRGSELAVQVTDTGIGIAADQQRQLFEPFNRLSQERSGIEGTGMGLAISQSLVALMHGRIEVHSEPGVGSTFSVVLPAAAVQSVSLPT